VKGSHGIVLNNNTTLQKDQNTATEYQVRNDTNNTAACARCIATYGAYSQYVQMAQLSPSFTTNGLLVASSSVLFSGGSTAGLRVFTADNYDLILGTNNTARITINATNVDIANGMILNVDHIAEAATSHGIVLDNAARIVNSTAGYIASGVINTNTAQSCGFFCAEVDNGTTPFYIQHYGSTHASANQTTIYSAGQFNITGSNVVMGNALTVTGLVTAFAATNSGYVDMHPGTATNSGYVEFYRGATPPTRIAYIGFNNDNLEITTERGYVYFGASAAGKHVVINNGLHVGGTSDPGDNNLIVDGAFGCNAAAAQTAYASGGALAAYATGAYGLNSDVNMSALHALVVKMRAALVANGIMS